jgi:hypothetical protein
MKLALKSFACCAALVLLSSPVLARSPRPDDEGGGGGNAVALNGPVNAVPEPAAALVFGVGAMIIASRVRRRNSEQ